MTDKGNETTQTLYQLATEPIFASDQNLRPHDNISWEVTSEPDQSNIPDSQDEIIPGTEPDIDKDLEISEEISGKEDPEKIEADSDSPEEEEKERIKKKNRTSEKKRIADLNRQLKQAQSVAHDVLTRNQFLEKKLTEKQKEALTQEENLLTSQKERIKQYLTDALEEGDSTKIAEAHDLLSQYNAELRLINSRKNATPEPEKQYTPPQQPQYYDSDEADYEIGIEWLENNPWANKHSKDFDQDLHEEADNYSIFLTKKYTLAGRKSEIGSAQFFSDISKYMKSSYEIEQGDQTESAQKPQPKGRMQMKTETTNKVAPVTRQSSSGETPRKGNDIVLTEDQKATARSLSGFVRDPKTGKKITDVKMLEEIYKRNLR